MKSDDDAEFLEKLRALSITAAHELLTGVDRLKLLSEEWAGDNRGNEVDTKQHARGLAFEFARTELQHAEKLLSISHSQADLLFKHAQRLMRTVRGGGQPPAAVLELVASAPGAPPPTQNGFAIHNGFASAADVRFDLEPFKSNSGEVAAWLEHAAKPRCTPNPVPARSAARVEIAVVPNQTAERKPGVYFSKLVVSLSADIERPVATRLLKLRVS